MRSNQNGFTALFFIWLGSTVFSAPVHAVPGSPTTRNYPQIQAFLRDVVRLHPQTTRLFGIGLNDQGQPIEGVMIGNGPIRNLIVGTHHGNEFGATEVALAAVEQFAARPVQGQTLFVIPVLNIGGYNQRARRENIGLISYDPNRDYPGPCGTEGPFKLKSTTALARFIDQQQIVNSMTLHTFQPAVVYPWGLSSADLSTQYDSLFDMLTKAAVIASGYKTGNSTKIIYPADGTYEDYAFWKHGIWSLLFELGYSHAPTDPQVAQMIAVNLPGMRNLLEKSPIRRADRHDFSGRCDTRLRSLDRHDE